MPVSEGVRRERVATSHGRYYQARLSAQRRKKLTVIQNIRKRKGGVRGGIRTNIITVEKPRITKGERSPYSWGLK